MATIKITLTRGLVGKLKTQRKVVQALGLGKYGSSAVHKDSPTIRGMVNKVHHLVTVVSASDTEMSAHKELTTKRTEKPKVVKAPERV